MALVLATTLRIGDEKTGKVKVVEEGTPFGDLTKSEKALAKELGLLVQVMDEEPTLEEEIEEAEAEEDSAEDSEGAEGEA